MLLFFMISRQKITEPSIFPASTTTTATAPTTEKGEEATESMGYALDIAERGKGMLQNTLGRDNHN